MKTLTGRWSVRAGLAEGEVFYVLTVQEQESSHYSYGRDTNWRDATAHDLMLLAQMGLFVARPATVPQLAPCSDN